MTCLYIAIVVDSNICNTTRLQRHHTTKADISCHRSWHHWGFLFSHRRWILPLIWLIELTELSAVFFSLLIVSNKTKLGFFGLLLIDHLQLLILVIVSRFTHLCIHLRSINDPLILLLLHLFLCYQHNCVSIILLFRRGIFVLVNVVKIQNLNKKSKFS